jgi:hypothetical protein
MVGLTQRIYRAWLAQNGAVKPRTSPVGGMGVVTPMQAQQGPASPSSRVQPPPPAPVVAARPAKRYSFISRGKDFRSDQ